MNYIKAILLSTTITLSIASPLNAMGGFGGDQMQNLQQELEEANRAIEEYISGLSPEEQEEFNRAVDELSQMFDNMSEDEFSSFLNDMFEDEPMMPSASEQPSTGFQQVQQEVISLTSDQKKKIENIITVINDVIRQLNIFLVQIGSSLEASKNITSWSKKGTITNWPAGTEWQTMKVDIEKFIQQLYTLEEKNPGTQEYRYILDLIADEATLDNLIQLQNNLNSSVPSIEVSELDVQTLSPQAKDAIKNTLEYISEALYLLQLPQSFNAIFEKYKPLAEKSREAEEAASKKAAELAKRPKTVVGSSSVGVANDGYGSDYGYSGGYGNDYGYDYGYSPSYGGYGDYGSSYGNYGGYGDFDDSGSSRKERGGSGGGFGGGSSGARGSAGEQAEATPRGLTPGISTESVIKKPRIKKLVNSIQTSLQEASSIITSNSLFSSVADHTTSVDEATYPVSADLENDIVKLNKSIKPVKEEIASLQSMLLKETPSTRMHYRETFVTLIEDSLETITSLKNDLEKINFKDISNKKQKISPEKEWAYFVGHDSALNVIEKNDANGKEKVDGLKQSIVERIPLKDLLTTLEELDRSINTLKSKTKVEQPTVSPSPVLPVQPQAEKTE